MPDDVEDADDVGDAEADIKGAVLASKVTGGVLVGLGALATGDPELAVLATAAMPVLDAAAEHVGRKFRARAAATVGVAAAAAGQSPDDFVRELSTDPVKLQLLLPALEAAQRSAWEDRVRVIGRALASGWLADDPALVDEERRWIEILASIEPPDLRIVDYLMTEDPERAGHMVLADRTKLAQVSGYRQLLGLALSRLEGNSLVRRQRGSDLVREDRNRWGFTETTEVFSRGELAGPCLDRFRAAAVSIPPLVDTVP